MNEIPDAEGDDLRGALHDAVADVRPDGTLDDIRSRTEVVPMNDKRWILPTLAAAVVLGLVIGGTAWLLRDDDDPTGATLPAGTPPPSATPTEPDATEGTVQKAIPVYYLGDVADGERLFREFQQMAVCKELDCQIAVGAGQAVGGGPIDPDYRTRWPAGAAAESATYADDLITVDLSGPVHDRPAGMSAEQAELSVQQLVFTVQAVVGQGRLPVQLLVDGKHSDTVLGVPAAEPLAAANADDVLAPVQVDSPEQGATVSSPIQVEGRAAAFEANVQWEVLVGGDAVVKEGFATAAECCTLSPYSFTLELEPGSYTLVVHDEDMSGEGRPVNQDTKEFTVE